MRECRELPFFCRWFTLAVLLAWPLSGAGEEEVLFRQTLPGGSDLTDGRYRDLTYSQGEWYGSTFFTGPDWTRVGKDWHHPGENTPSVRCLVVPQDGRVTVTGRVFKLHQSGDGIRAVVRHNDRDVWSAEIAGADGEGVTHDLALEVRQGDRIRFVVHKRGNIGCDTTGWDPSVRWEKDNRTCRASEAFAAHTQGADGWRYEMEMGAAQAVGLPDGLYLDTRVGTAAVDGPAGKAGRVDRA